MFTQKAKLVLIHGSTCGAKYSIFRDRCLQDGSYKAFVKDIESGEARLFVWAYILDELSFWQSLNPIKLIDVYRGDKNYVYTENAISKLRTFLQTNPPKVVLAHSVGCEYLLNYINEYGLPDGVETIITIQSDGDNRSDITHLETIKKLQNKKLKWLNFHCYWDSTLWLSTLLNRKIPAGIAGYKSKLAENIFFKLNFLNDPHTSILRNQKFRDMIFRANH